MPEHEPPHDDHEIHIADADEFLHHHTSLPETKFSQISDKILSLIGQISAWMWLAVVGLILYAVIGRYAFGQGSVTLEEWQWHVAGATWMLGLSYTLVVDDHVRVDVLHERMGLKTQAWVEFFGLILLLLPFLGLAIWEMVPYALSSLSQGERSQAPAGLSNRWILKAIVALSFVLLTLASLSRLTKVTALLFGFPTPIKASKKEGNA